MVKRYYSVSGKRKKQKRKLARSSLTSRENEKSKEIINPQKSRMHKKKNQADVHKRQHAKKQIKKCARKVFPQKGTSNEKDKSKAKKRKGSINKDEGNYDKVNGPWICKRMKCPKCLREYQAAYVKKHLATCIGTLDRNNSGDKRKLETIPGKSKKAKVFSKNSNALQNVDTISTSVP